MVNADLTPTLQDARLEETRLRWCNLVGPQPYADGHGFRSVVKVLSNVHLWDGPPEKSSWCRCPRGSHALYEDYLTGLANYERRRQLWQGIVYYLLMLTNSGVPLVQATRHWGARPELHWKELGRKELRGGSPPTHSKLPSNPTSAHATSHEAGGGKSRQPKWKKQEEEKNEARQSDAKVSALLSANSSDSEQLMMLDRIVNHAHDEIDLLLLDAQSAEKAFPTEQRLRQKARAKAGHVAKKRPQVVEDHHDDCGEDFGPLGDDPYFQDAPEHQTDSDEEVCMPSWDFGMNGCEWTPETSSDFGVSAQQMVFQSLEAFNAWNDSAHGSSGGSPPAYHDAAELCGGAGDTGTLLVRRQYLKGPNFDIIAGYDLKKETTVK